MDDQDSAKSREDDGAPGDRPASTLFRRPRADHQLATAVLALFELVALRATEEDVDRVGAWADEHKPFLQQLVRRQR